MSAPFANDDHSRFRSIFDSIDVDKTGGIAVRELKRAMRMIGAPSAACDIHAMIKLGDKDCDGSVDFEEFCSIVNLAKKFRYAQLVNAFKVFDTDSSGEVSASEFAAVLDRIGLKATNEERAAMLKRADEDCNGKLSLLEFLHILGYRGPVYSESDLEGIIEAVNGLEVFDDQGGSDDIPEVAAEFFKLTCQNFYFDETYTLDVEGEWSVAHLVEHLAAHTNFPGSIHSLYYNGFPLVAENTLKSYHMSGSRPVFFIYGEGPGELAHGNCFDSRGIPQVENIYRHFLAEGRLRADDAAAIVRRAGEIMAREPNLLTIEDESKPIYVCGDLHGQFFDLQEMRDTAGCGFDGSAHWVFMGDYVDRGYFSAEVLLYLYAAKVAFPDTVHLLRGNHESASQNKKCGTMEEFEAKYGPTFYPLALESFFSLPIAALIKHHGHSFLCCHGGVAQAVPKLADFARIQRHQEVPTIGGLKLTLWADPHDDNTNPTPWASSFDLTALERSDYTSDGEMETFADAAFFKSSRGDTVRNYGRAAVLHFLRENGLTAVFRGHEQKENGFEGYRRGPHYVFPSVVTIFSAPNYTDKSLNFGAVARLSRGSLTFLQYKWRLHPQYYPAHKDDGTPHPKAYQKNKKMDDFLLFVNHLHPESLSRLTIKQLATEYNEMFLTDSRHLSNPTVSAGGDDDNGAHEEADWTRVSESLYRVLELSKDPSVRSQFRRRSSAMLMWYSGIHQFAHAVDEESSYETDDDVVVPPRSKSGRWWWGKAPEGGSPGRAVSDDFAPHHHHHKERQGTGKHQHEHEDSGSGSGDDDDKEGDHHGHHEKKKKKQKKVDSEMSERSHHHDSHHDGHHDDHDHDRDNRRHPQKQSGHHTSHSHDDQHHHDDDERHKGKHQEDPEEEEEAEGEEEEREAEEEDSSKKRRRVSSESGSDDDESHATKRRKGPDHSSSHHGAEEKRHDRRREEHEEAQRERRRRHREDRDQRED